MRYLITAIALIYSFVSMSQSDSIMNFNKYESGETNEMHCDSVITIEKFGNIVCKLIFEQTDIDISNKNLIVIQYTELCSSDHSIIVSNHPMLSKTKLKLGYDTCYISDFKKKDYKRAYSEFVAPADTAGLHNWNVEINCIEKHCLDTDFNFLRAAKNDTDYIEFSCLHNIQLFELDLNNDRFNELYIISYIWCASEIRIYRIDIQTMP